MSYSFYKIVHLISLLSLFLSFGMLLSYQNRLRALAMSLHGISCLVLLVSGFGLIAKTSIHLKISENIVSSGLQSILWITPIFVYWMMSKKIKFSISSDVLAAISVILFYMFLLTLAEGLVPYWIGVKMAGWLLFSFSFLFVLSKHQSFSKWNVWIVTLILVVIGGLTIFHAIDKKSQISHQTQSSI